MRVILLQNQLQIYYLTHRLIHNDAETRKILSKLFTLFHLLDTASLDCRKAISSEIGDYEGAIMVETAIRSGMDCIVTRNVKDYTKSSVKVCEPSALLKLLEEENELRDTDVSRKNKRYLPISLILSRARDGDRTRDPLLGKEVLHR